MAYRATIGGAFGGGAGPAAAHPIDAGSIIDAITNGASSLIQNAYMRKQAEAGQADKAQQRAQEEKRYTDTVTRDEQRYNQQRADKAADLERQGVKDAYQREFDAKKLESENLKAGITPGRTTITREPEATAPAPSIASSFQSADLSAGGPATPSPLTARPSLGTIPRLNISSTPDQFTPKPTAQQHVVDPVTGEVKFFDPTKPPVGMRLNTVPRRDPTATARLKAPSDGQIASAMFAARMNSAEVLLGQYEGNGKPGLMTTAAGGTPFVGNRLQNMVASKDQQLYRQAQEDWVRAKLRKESGAAIGKDEMADEISTYFPQLNDAPELVAQKAERRAEAVRLLGTSAGNAQAMFGAPNIRQPSGDSGNVDLRRPGGRTVTVNGKTFTVPD